MRIICNLIGISTIGLMSLSMVASSAQSPTDTADRLVSQCKVLKAAPTPSSSKELADAMYCLGFVRGTVNGINASVTVLRAEGKDVQNSWFCTPEASNINEYALVFLKYMDEHPEQLHKPATFGVFNAMVKYFPCR